MEAWLEYVRSRIPITRRKVYLDNAGAGPLSVDVRIEIDKFLNLWEEYGEPWHEALEDLQRIRAEFASFIGARADEIAAVPGVTYGLNSLLSSLKLNPNSNVVVSGINFPTGVYAFHAMRRRGLISEVRVVEPEDGCVGVDGFEKAIDDRTSIVYVDLVSWITGCVEDIKEIAGIASRHGSLLVTDIFQGVGVVPVDVKSLRVDAALTGSYKWLMGLHGAGFVYVSRGLLEDLEPAYSGWMAVDDSVLERMRRGEELFSRPFDLKRFARAKDAKVLEWGTWPVIAFISLKASLKLLKEFDAPGKYKTHTRRLVSRLIEGLSDMGLNVVTPPESSAAIVVFKHDRPKELGLALSRSNIVISVRPGSIRVSPHFYNTIDEIEHFLEAVRRFRQGVAG